MKITFVLLYIIISLFPSILLSNSFATIAALVGNEVISTSDVYNRVYLTMTIMNIEKNQDNADSLLPKILQQLIDEKLITKEAKNMKIFANKDEIDNTISDIEEQNNLGANGFIDLLKQNNINIDIAKDQIKSQILWSKIIGQSIRPKLTVSENELIEVLNTATPGQAQVTFKQILIPIKIFKSEKDLNDVIIRLTELRNKVSECNDMEMIYKNMFNNSEIDTITLPIDQIHNELQNMVKVLPIGKASKVIKSKTSLRILSVCSRDFIGLDNKSREEVSDIIMQKKIMIQANHYMNNLRKKAFIEVYI